MIPPVQWVWVEQKSVFAHPESFTHGLPLKVHVPVAGHWASVVHAEFGMGPLPPLVKHCRGGEMKFDFSGLLMVIPVKVTRTRVSAVVSCFQPVAIRAAKTFGI